MYFRKTLITQRMLVGLSHWRTIMIKNWKKYNRTQLKLFFQDSDGINEYLNFPEDKIDQSGDDCIENHINDMVSYQSNKPLDKTPVENSQSNQIPDETPDIVING